MRFSLANIVPRLVRTHGIRIRGTAAFSEATSRAIDLIAQSEYFDVVREQTPAIYQRFRSANRVAWGKGVVHVGSATWNLSSIEYAAELIRTASRHEKYKLGFWLGHPEVEADCSALALAAVHDLGGTTEAMDRTWRRVTENALRFVNAHAVDRLRYVCAKRGLFRRARPRQDKYDSVVIQGCQEFVDNTKRAFALLQQCDDYPLIRGNIASVQEMTRNCNFRAQACIDVHATEPRVYVASYVGECEAPLLYASTLAHEAFHNVLFTRGELDHGIEAERRCYDFQVQVLKSLDAPQSIIRWTEGWKRSPGPGLEFDEQFWSDFDWKRFRESGG